ncbi:MAG: acyl-CoA dehydrogenase family protein [Burkholderiaceae bacterium]|nr:acyl-CoA dehydrogenase family protein [Burkholderiaceae bacterium]
MIDQTYAADAMLEPEHLEFRDAFRRFVRQRLAPLAMSGEQEKRFPKEVYAALREGGYLAPDWPEELGGAGGDILVGCVYYEELTRIPAGVSAGVFAHQHLALRPLQAIGTASQQREYLLPGLRAERIGAFALTEPDAGSDIMGIRTRARRDGDDWILSGSKLYITNGTIADFYLVAARTSPQRRPDALSIFVVDAGARGLSARPLDKLGNHSSSTALVSLYEVRVGPGQLLGQIGGGLGQLKATLSSGRILQATRGLGIAQMALEHALAYAQQRQAFGQPIGSFQGVAFKVAEMAARIEAARLMIYSAACRHMAGKDASKQASMAKFMTADAVQYAVLHAINVHGGYGYMEESGLPRLYRDAPESYIGEGTPDIQLRIVARALGMKC